jgi:hypothetical protein
LGSGVPDVYIVSTVSSWSNSSITFTVPEYASIGTYQLEVQTAYGASAPVGGFSVIPVINGWVDLHTHPMSNLGFGGKLIYGAVDNNKNGSLFVLGTPTNVLGVVAPGSPCPRNRVQNENDALSDENSVRGPGGQTLLSNPCGDSIRTGITAIMESQLNARVWNPLTYASSGYPNFPTWPTWDDLFSQKMYYTWIKRSYQGGLRVMVALAVNSKLLADMTSGPGDGPDDDKASGDLQITEIQSFVGRHSDFMQVANSSSDIQNIVSQNKLAVVIGVELDNIGDLVSNQSACIPNVTGTGYQSPCPLVQEVDRLYAEGVRYIFPIHLVDNPIGGSATYQDLFNVANVYEEGGGYPLGCATTDDNITYAYTPPSSLTTIGAFVKLGTNTPGIPPAFPPCNNNQKGNVNTMGLSAAGQQAIQEMMNKHMLIDIDHMSEASAKMTISLALAHQPYPYPLNSGHNGIRGMGTPPFSERSFTVGNYGSIGKLHGMSGVGSAKMTADQWLAMYTKVIQAMGPGASAGFGTDINGMEFAMPPRCSTQLSSGQCPNPISNVQYGTGTFSPCPAVTLLPMSTEGNGKWDYNKVGVAHYGMLPDFLQDVASQIGGCAVVGNMNDGAQYFYETWRIAEGNASALAPPPPPIPTQPGPLPACPGIQELNTSGNTGNITGSGPACVCAPPTKLNAWGVCPSSAGATSAPSNTNDGQNGIGCPSECKYGCSAQRICNGPLNQTHLPN